MKKTILSALALSLGLLAPQAQAQIAFATPEAAAEAFSQALAIGDETRIGKILGPGYQKLLPTDISQDDVYDFLAAWAQQHRIAREPANTAWLDVGASNWRLPIPIVERGQQWRFDMRAAEPEIRKRQIGRNELGAIETLRALQNAQQAYSSSQGHYANRLVSRRGQRDGLYWPEADGQGASPLGIEALVMGPDTPAAAAYYGYRFAILPPADGQPYRIAAWPAQYGMTGVHRFIATPKGITQNAQPGRPGTGRNGEWAAVP